MVQERARVTRSQVLRAAAVVFDRHGFFGASINDILQEAGVTRGALYFHFASKDDLARELIEHQSTWQRSQTPRSENPLQQVIDLSFDFVRALQADPLLAASIRLTLERNTFASDDAAPYEGWVSPLTTMLTRAKDAGTLRAEVDPREAAELIAASVTGTQLASEAATARADVVVRIQAMWRLLVHAIATPEATRTLDLSA